MGSSSRARTETSQQTQNTSSNINLQDVSGPAVGSAGGDVSITSTDHGAIEAAGELGQRSLDTVDNTVGEAFSFGEKVVDSNIKAVDSSLDFGGKAISAVSDANDRSLDFGENALSGAFNFGGEALKLQAESNKATTATLSGAIERAAAATRTDASQSLDKITKAGMAVGIAVAVAFVAYFIFKK